MQFEQTIGRCERLIPDIPFSIDIEMSSAERLNSASARMREWCYRLVAPRIYTPAKYCALNLPCMGADG